MIRWLMLLLSCFVLVATANAQSNSAAAYTFTTFAGYSGAGSADGVGSFAQFSDYFRVAVDSADNVYVADAQNQTIRKITPAGIVSTIAGFAGISGSADGMNSSAQFNLPTGLAVDTNGNLYVADQSNCTIRKITPVGTNWVVSTIAGLALSQGSVDGTNGDARFHNPVDVAVDRAGNLYVADFQNRTIRKLMPLGTNWVVSTLAGLAGVGGTADGTNGQARFGYPSAVAVDSGANVYVVDNSFSTIRKITPDGVVTTIAGSAGFAGSADGVGSAARFRSPNGVAVDSEGNLYVADQSNNAIRKITAVGPDWVVSTFAGLAGTFGSTDGTGTNARFGGPLGVAVNVSGNIYAADYGNHTVRKINTAAVVSTLAGSAGSQGSVNGTGPTARFKMPYGVAVDRAGIVYVADTDNDTIRLITSAGLVSTMAGLALNTGSADGAGSVARFFRPEGIAVDGRGVVYVADSGNHTIRKITAAGVVSTIAGSAQTRGDDDGANGNAQFNHPSAVAVDSASNVYVADRDNHTIRMVQLVGINWVVSTIAGNSSNRDQFGRLIGGYADGTNEAALFNGPQGLAIDGAGNIYVVEKDNYTVRKITPVGTNWVVSTIAGSSEAFAFENFGNVDGMGRDARFGSYQSGPTGVAVDNAGNLYVADVFNYTLRKIAPFGTNWLVSTIGGQPGPYGFGSRDGSGNAARFGNAGFGGPRGVAVDTAGTVYVADHGNNTIRKGVFTQYAPVNRVPYAPPPMNGQLTVTLTPPEANGQWRFPWEFGWHSSGYTASNLVAGNYPIEFRNVPGWLAIPSSRLAPLSSGATVSITNEYYPTISAGDTNSTPGSLTVYLGSVPPTNAGWRFLGENTPFLPTAYTTNLLPGTYLIEFAAVSGRVKPSSQAVQINAGLSSALSVNYLVAATPPANVYLPFPVPANQVSDESIYPFGFNGQLQSDTGYGSGVAVSTNVVLTAAHLVFNDQTLSYVSRAHWFFRRDAGVSEPLPQEARGFYILSGYAMQRTNDLQSGYSPDQSTPPSRNMDVAALYFLQAVAGGGHGGYLPSDAVPNTWLTSTALKMIVGYPVDGPQFDVASIVPGKIYQTEPQPYPLSLATDPVPGQQQVYTAPWFLSYPGNSGGPLYVQLNGYYYPAAVYLGTLFSGAQPYASVVRAIDSNVVNLITLAATQGDSGTNFTGGGVITIIPSQGISARNPGYVQFRLTPQAAVRVGAGWRLHGDTAYSSATNYTRPVTSTNIFAVEFKPILGWTAPNSQAVTVLPGQITPYTASYSVNNPVLSYRAAGIGMTGTTGTLYRVERRSTLSSGAWLPLSTNAMSSTGFNLVVPRPATNPPTSFYRLLWLP